MTANGNVAMNVKVINISNEKTAVSDGNGEFSIEAKADEMLVFPSEKYEYKRFLVDESDLKKEVIVLALVEKPIELDEVVINYDVNPEDLGIVPKGQKQYTVAERRLKQAGEFKPELFVGMVAGLSIPIDPIINAITGRTKMLKKDVKTERKEMHFKKLNSIYEPNYYTEKLKIDPEFVEGFKYYAVEDSAFIAAINSGVKAKLDFCLVGLAQKYNQLHATESK